MGSLVVTETEQSSERLRTLQAELRHVLRMGLPLDPELDVPALLELHGVRARAVRIDDRLSRLNALDKLLRRLVAREADLGAPAAALLGIQGGNRSLTARRDEAARVAGYDVDHFRKRIEPKLIERLAWALERDSDSYRSRKRPDPPKLAVSGDTPEISEEDITDAERSEHEELLSRIWSDVYLLRAELLRREREKAAAQGEPEALARFQEAASAALLVTGRLLYYLDEYMEKHGKAILHGEAEFNAEGLLRLAGWSGELTPAQARELKWAWRRG